MYYFSKSVGPTANFYFKITVILEILTYQQFNNNKYYEDKDSSRESFTLTLKTSFHIASLTLL